MTGVDPMSNFRPINRDTGFLLPPSVDEWLPEKHLARFVVEVIDGLDLRAMSGSYRGSGSASYHPALLLGMLKMGTVGLDGTKIHANASRHSALSYEQAGKIEARLKTEVGELMVKAEAADRADVPDGMSIPDELARRGRRSRRELRSASSASGPSHWQTQCFVVRCRHNCRCEASASNH